MGSLARQMRRQQMRQMAKAAAKAADEDAKKSPEERLRELAEHEKSIARFLTEQEV